MEKISVIIPTMNRYESLNRTLEYLFLGIIKPAEIIVVDQTKDKDVADRIKYLVEVCYKGKYFYQKEPSSTKARNLGIEFALNDILLIMDDDVDVKTDTLKNIIQILSDKNVAMIGGLNTGDELIRKNSLFGYLFFMSSYYNRHIGHVTKGMYGRFPIHCGKSTYTMWTMGFFMIFRKSLIQKWNLRFDENLKYYAYAEDLDFSFSYYKKACKENLECLMSTDIIVNHNISNEYRIPSKSATFMQIVHREYLSYKHFSNPFNRVIVRIANFGNFIYRLINNKKPSDLFKAQLFCDKYRADIKKGIFHYEKFM